MATGPYGVDVVGVGSEYQDASESPRGPPEYQDVESVNVEHLPSNMTFDKGVLKFGYTTTPSNVQDTLIYTGDDVIAWSVDREKLRVTGQLQSEIYQFTYQGVHTKWQLIFSSAHLYEEQRWVSLLLKLVEIEGAKTAAMQVKLEIELDIQEERGGPTLHAECSGILRAGDRRGPKLVRLAAAPLQLRIQLRLQSAPLAAPFCMTLVPGKQVNGNSDSSSRECHLKVLWDICQWQHFDCRHGAEISTPLFGACGALFRLCLRPNGDHLQPPGSISLSVQADYLPGALRRDGVKLKIRILLTNRLMEHEDTVKEGEVRGGCFALRTDLIQFTDLLIQVDLILQIPEELVPQTKPNMLVFSRPMSNQIKV